MNWDSSIRTINVMVEKSTLWYIQYLGILIQTVITPMDLNPDYLINLALRNLNSDKYDPKGFKSEDYNSSNLNSNMHHLKGSKSEFMAIQKNWSGFLNYTVVTDLNKIIIPWIQDVIDNI